MMNRPTSRTSLRSAFRSEEGSALIVILAVSVLLSLLVGVAFSVARQSIAVADETEEYNAALAAAEAGLDDYLFRLNSIDAYWQYPAAGTPPDNNQAFDNFVPIPGGETDTNQEDIGMFTYTVDASQLTATGVIWLTATGCAPGPCDINTGPTDAQEFRTLQSSFSLESFLDYVYFTDFESSPPVIYPGLFGISETQARTDCSRHRWATPGPAGYCTDIRFTSGDVINGPFHTNDRFIVDGNPRWLEEATTSDPVDPHYDLRAGTPQFDGGEPTPRSPLNFPSTNSAIRFDADHISNPSAEGCLFTGPTEIVISGGNLLVRSPLTQDSGPGCGLWPAGNNVRTIPIPPNGVVYVQDQPPSGPNGGNCTTGNSNALGYPWGGDDSEYPCGAGDAFVEGTLDGRLTIAAEKDVYITWHTEYAGGNDMLGLVANDLVQVYHPTDYYGCTNCGNSNRRDYYANLNAGPRHPGSLFRNPRIDAALLSVQNSFMVQNYNHGHIRGTTQCAGDLGDLTINGAIAQRFRGPVGTGSAFSTCTGYLKDYNYDQRLRFINPPSFIDPVDAVWRISRYSEVLANS
ncbi:hypothetical protein [Euzebya tangerina]|uniref:hypothetical protein n=1 Tax=Euzebya tangerina TaxID=591198 RepID=UPI000E315AA8|nr:hypothetical protein [Euzebya tangerina]